MTNTTMPQLEVIKPVCRQWLARFVALALAMTATAKVLDFRIVSVKTESQGGAASSMVECAGTVVFDTDADWGMNGVQKAGEPAKFECNVEYLNQGDGWQIFGPMGIYPL